MKKILLLAVLVIMIFTLSSCRRKNRVTKQTFAFDTVINITADKKDSDKIEEALRLCRRYDKIFSRTDHESELFLINEKKITSLSDDIKEVLDFSLKMSAYTDGAFDITVAPLVDLWNVGERTSPPKIQKSQRHFHT